MVWISSSRSRASSPARFSVAGEKMSAPCSSSCFFHSLIWFGWTWYSSASLSDGLVALYRSQRDLELLLLAPASSFVFAHILTPFG